MGGAELQILAPENDGSNSRQDRKEHASVVSLCEWYAASIFKIQSSTIVQAHSQAPCGLGRHLRYLSQVTQHLNFCRVLSCCQCLLQGHTRPSR